MRKNFNYFSHVWPVRLDLDEIAYFSRKVDPIRFAQVKLEVVTENEFLEAALSLLKFTRSKIYTFLDRYYPLYVKENGFLLAMYTHLI